MTTAFCKIYFIILLILFNLKLNSQNPIFDYLKSSNSKTENVIDSIINFYNTSRLHKPFISRLSLRTETDEFKLNRQEYSLRAQTNSISYNNYQNKINKLEQEEWQIKKKILYTSQLYKKYKVVTKLLGVLLLKNAQDQYIKSIEKQLDILNYKSGIVSNINFEKHLDLNLKLLNAKNEFNDLSNKQSILQNDSLLNHNLDLLFNKLISNEDILKVTNQLEIANFNNSLYLNELNKQQLEYKQEIREATKKLDYLQIHYHDDPSNLVNQKLTVGAGFRIPMMRSNQKIKDEYEIKRLNLSLEQLQENDDAELKLVELKNQLYQLIASYDNLVENQRFILKKFNPDTLASSELSDPVFIAEIRQELAKINIDQIAIRNDIIQLYIQIIYISKTLYNNPDRYYLEYPFIEF
ncbi:MAG: hypothetical protein IPI45_04270 [Saprospiraceae bacterium]|nr:hypothetical protein [Saprospiraceae bacterium]MBK7736977.1 hypothetical protein [Saprospiraceae bacterium]MBK7914429.1 hypothetical protein [Saprospiraceae bacterium]